MVAVMEELKILKCELINICYLRVNLQNWKRLWNSLNLLFQWLNMVFVNMGISKHMNEFSSLKSANLGYHASQKSIACNVKGNSKTHISSSLV